MKIKLGPRPVVIIFGLILLLLVVLQFLPITVPYTVKVAGKLLPAQEWIIRKLNDGSVMTSFHDYTKGVERTYSATQIERGDAMNFALTDAILAENVVAKGDTVAVVSSSELNLQLARLQRDLAVAEGSLQSNLSGEKMAIVEEARKQLQLAQEELNNQLRIFTRQDSLYRNGLISQAEFELAENKKSSAELEMAIAKSRLEVVASGAKPAAIRMLRDEITAIQNEIRLLQERIRALTLISPLSGRIGQVYSSDTLLTICDTTAVVLMPVEMKYFHEISPSQPVRISLLSREYKGTVCRKEYFSYALNNKQVFLVFADFDDIVPQIPSGLIVPCAIQIRLLKPWQYLGRFLRSIFI